MTLLRGVLCRRVALRLCWLRFRVNGLVTLDVPAKAKAHSREHFFSESMFLSRAKSGVERQGEYVRWHRFLDRGFDGPAALAGILNKAGEILQLRILRQRRGAKIEQPRRNHTAAPPNLGDIRHV